MDLWIWGVGAVTAAGPTIEDFWQALIEGRTCITGGVGRVESREKSSLETLVSWIHRAQAQVAAPAERQGLIFASTKGALEDYIWKSDEPRDPVHDIYQRISKQEFAESISISSACASGLVGLELASRWIQAGRVDGVWLVTCDEVGKFVESGFASLKAISPSGLRPFSSDRDGLQLGEAAVAIYISKSRPPSENAVRVTGVAIETEGFAVTRPEASGASVIRVTTHALGGGLVDLAIAHGTGTRVNDQIEDRVYSQVLGDAPVTCTKWCVGHTLASSAALDLAAGFMVLKKQKAFTIATIKEIDPSFAANYITSDSTIPLQRVLLTSLGFGGVHAAATLELG